MGVVVTALYSFRLYFLVFHGKERMDDHTRHHLHESPWVVTLPLVLLAILSAGIAWFTIEPLLVNDWFQGAIYVVPVHNVLQELQEHYHGAAQYVIHGIHSEVFTLGTAGMGIAAVIWWLLHALFPKIDQWVQSLGGPLTRLLQDKYGFDDFNQRVFGNGGQSLGRALWNGGDRVLIDGAIVNGSARSVGRLAGVARRLQTGLLYHYAIAMIVGLVGLLTIFVAL
jgi:NADH-quinone oxidoreductase subunit L